MASGRGYSQAEHACPRASTISFARMHVGLSEWDFMSLVASNEPVEKGP